MTAHHNLTLANQRAAAKETAKIERHERNFRRVTDLANQRTDEHTAREIKHRKEMGRLEQEQRDQTVAFDRQRRREELKHVKEQQRVITSGFQDRLRIVKKSQKNAAREQRLLMETIDKVDDLDEF